MRNVRNKPATSVSSPAQASRVHWNDRSTGGFVQFALKWGVLRDNHLWWMAGQALILPVLLLHTCSWGFHRAGTDIKCVGEHTWFNLCKGLWQRNALWILHMGLFQFQTAEEQCWIFQQALEAVTEFDGYERQLYCCHKCQKTSFKPDTHTQIQGKSQKYRAWGHCFRDLILIYCQQEAEQLLYSPFLDVFVLSL